MRFGGPVLKPFNNPEEWIKIMQDLGYNACTFPLNHTAPTSEIDAYAAAAKAADIMIAEVGVWNNPISNNKEESKKARQYAKDQLALADYIGAACCVNIAGAKGEQWDGPHKDNWTCFDEIVSSVQEIIDDVKPTKTYYSLETMPWIYPHNADSYVELIKAIDRERFGAHLDVINIITSPYAYYHNADITRECFEKFGDRILACHAKDIILANNLTVHLDEMAPGQGEYDFTVLIDCLRKYPDVPMMMEHMNDPEEVEQAAAYLKGLL